ncbi:MAG: DUF61 family protein [Methanomicrobiales archaeon]|nr:DUF61 family protein [Methanomicrobiales archaeon]
MAHAPRPHDEPVLRRWMSLEAKKINDGIVADRKPLSLLLREEQPSAQTKGGKTFTFDRAVLLLLRDRLPADMHRKLRLPMICYYSPDVHGSYYLSDECAVLALQELGEISPLRSFEQGRLWIAKPIMHAIMQTYPTVIQVAIGV